MKKTRVLTLRTNSISWLTMAIVMPGVGFEGCSLLLPRMLGYFGTHYMVQIEALALLTFGFFRPEFRDLPMTLITIAGITFAVFLFDMLLRVTGLYPRANYFFAVETEGNFLLDLFYSWIPLPFLYLIRDKATGEVWFAGTVYQPEKYQEPRW